MSRLSRLALANPRLYVIPAFLAFGAMTMTLPVPASAQVALGVSVQVAPPPLVEYEQPPLPGPGYLWTPGYWAYGDAGYFWVPGTWAEPPAVGLLWTPGYWGWNNGGYLFNAGYWGATVGFYGGINYGFGFGGIGYEGGFWRDGAFSYNRAVNNFGGVRITNAYDRPVVNDHPGGAAFNGPGGIDRRPEGAELAAARERHIDATPAQVQHREAAAHERGLLASENHGRPAITATSRPGDFSHAAAGAHPVTAARPGAEPHAVAEHAPGPHPMAHAPAPMRHAMASHAPAPHAVEHHAPAPHMAAHVATPHPAVAPHPAAHASAPAPRPIHTASMTPRSGPMGARAPMAPHAAPHPAAPHPAAPAHQEKPRG